MAEENKGFLKGLWGRLGGKAQQSESEQPDAPERTEPEVPVKETAPPQPPQGAPPVAQEELLLPVQEPEGGEAEEPAKRGFFERFAKFPLGKETPEEEAVAEPVAKPSLFDRLKQGLSRTHESIVGRVDALLLGKKRIDADTLEELEEILITADIGVKTTVDLVRTLEQRMKRNELQDGDALKKALKEEILLRLQEHAAPLAVTGATPFVILVIGVNGVGKTTTIGKLAAKYQGEGKKVLLAAADTFRAAAAEQLELWARRVGADLVRHKEGADPSAVVFDACKAAVARGTDVLIIDTAGRMHTKVNLMEEMKKIRRVVSREIPEAPHETLLVLDAGTGQNALSQAKLFKEAAFVSGVALTKLDGTAKGGIVVAVSQEYSLPVRFIGVGESVEDLREFDPVDFVEALFQ
ncbi:signal recognition particle-docking protein FtsY [Geomonas sp. RF6]|uniref:signal recognition particle-docking protein FtsY n=1 Tax=Geomonas sp. RF6 TaxID=2897342 RepID=UPI001E3AD6C9|nr:signal recognition particle-docking protein FtsY [Geomonas sp. RF6]UFS68762.1 signal recognition particle-docking protein FtsY [Geomonas sp. RF6]